MQDLSSLGAAALGAVQAASFAVLGIYEVSCPKVEKAPHYDTSDSHSTSNVWCGAKHNGTEENR